jgi:hypothetical protein
MTSRPYLPSGAAQETSRSSRVPWWRMPFSADTWRRTAYVLFALPLSAGWSGLGLGAVTVLAAIALLLREDLFPGVLLYGLLISIVVPLWSMALGVVLWRRAAEIQKF